MELLQTAFKNMFQIKREKNLRIMNNLSGKESSPPTAPRAIPPSSLNDRRLGLATQHHHRLLRQSSQRRPDGAGTHRHLFVQRNSAQLVPCFSLY